MTPNNTVSSITALVQEVLPDAQVTLFGSRANGNPTAESDWDILILTNEEVTRALKNKVHEKLFPFSVKIRSFINFILINREQWQNDPSYYSLHINIRESLHNAP